jgi:hypothetical protein
MMRSGTWNWTEVPELRLTERGRAEAAITMHQYFERAFNFLRSPTGVHYIFSLFQIVTMHQSFERAFNFLRSRTGVHYIFSIFQRGANFLFFLVQSSSVLPAISREFNRQISLFWTLTNVGRSRLFDPDRKLPIRDLRAISSAGLRKVQSEIRA